jgi:hypothetical protein
VTRAAGAAFISAAALVATVLAQSDVDVIRITLGRADIRSEPSPAAPILRQVTEGSYLIVIKEDAGWFQVQLPASRGLRALGYLQKTSAVRVKPAEATAAPRPCGVLHPFVFRRHHRIGRRWRLGRSGWCQATERFPSPKLTTRWFAVERERDRRAGARLRVWIPARSACRLA